ncbi:DNA topoisomerase family protein, partial [Vibrio parahaemolyticus AQ3810]
SDSEGIRAEANQAICTIAIFIVCFAD